MYRKKFKQFLAVMLSAAMLAGNIQYANAADYGNDNEIIIDFEGDEAGFDEDSSDFEMVVVDENSDEEVLPETVGIVEEDEVAEEASADEADSEDSIEAAEEASFDGETDADEAAEDAGTDSSAENSSDSSSADATVQNLVELPEGIVGMPEDYELTEKEAKIKALAVSGKNNYNDNFASLVEGVDYAKDEVVFLADTKEHAEEVAKAFAGTVKSFEEGVAVIDLSETEVNVADAYSCAFIEGINLPVVTPNYYFHVDEAVKTDGDFYGLFAVDEESLDATGEASIEEDDEYDATAEVASEDSEDIVDNSEQIDEAAFDKDSLEENEAAVEDFSADFDTNKKLEDVEKADEEYVGAAVLEDTDEVNTNNSENADDSETAAEASETDSADAEEVEEAEDSAFTELLNAEPYLNASAKEYQWYHSMIGTFTAWEVLGVDKLSKTSSVTVAVIDSGVAAHSELNLVNEAGFTDDHGTLVAGVIGAKLNANGGAGIAPGANILNLQTDFSAACVMTQLNKAVEAKADIVNMSFVSECSDPQFEIVVNDVYENGITVVAPMGDNKTENPLYPAAYEHVIAVASVNEAGIPSSYTATGTWCDIAAPGSNIWSTKAEDGYEMVSGTAMAAPVVAGACALYMAEYGHVSPDKMEEILKNTADVTDFAGIGVGVLNVNSLVAPQLKATSSVVISKLSVKANFTNAKQKYLTYNYANGSGSSVSLTATAIANTKSDISGSVSYVWTSSNPEVLAVSGSGRSATVTARSVGSAKITVKAKNGSMKNYKTASVSVTVKTTKKLIGSVEIWSQVANNASNNKAYNLKYNKNNSMKSASLYVSAGPGSMGITARQFNTAKDKKQVSSASPIWTSSNPKVLTVTSTGGNNANIVAVGKGRATVTCTARDGSGKKASVAIEVRKAVTSLAINGQKYIGQGASAKYSVTANKDASSKAVTWSLVGAPSGVEITPAGQVKVGKNVPLKSSFTVKAKAQDNGGKEATYAVQVFNKAKKVDLSASSVTLATVAIGKLSKSGSVTAKPDNGTAVTWSSPQNGKIINISQSGNTVNFSAIKSGSATITATATDGSNKKASVKVKVIVPVSGLSLGITNNQIENIVATGGSIKFNPKLGNTYGNPSIKKVKWTFTVYGNGSSPLSDKDAKKIASFSNGRIGAKGNAFTQLQKMGYSSATFVMKAETTDGSNHSATKSVSLTRRLVGFGFPQGNRYRRIVYPIRVGQEDYIPGVVVDRTGEKGSVTSPYPYTVKASNKNIIAECRQYNGSYILYIKGVKKGSAKVTVKTRDGSNISSSMEVEIR